MSGNDLPRHHSVTHLHLLSCLDTLLGERLSEPATSSGDPLRILDIGCGDGRLMAYLHTALTALRRGQSFELYGFDVREQGWGVAEEYLHAIWLLETSCPGVPWGERLRLVSAQEPWPFPDNYFDAAVSNLVFEHVADADLFLGSLRRVLKKDGVSVHLFPLTHCWQEGHVMVPLAHWFRDVEQQQAWIALVNRLGAGRWRKDKVMFGEPDLTSYAKSQAAYLHSHTFYRSFAQIHELCRRHNLALSHRFTRDLHAAKLREVLRLRPRLRYRKRALLGIDSALFLGFRHLSASTLVMAPVSYDVSSRVHAEARARASAEPRLPDRAAAAW